jgi:hypothetical protein
MKKAGIVLVALLVVAVAGSAFAAPARKVYYEKPSGQIAYKPKRIDFSDLTLTKIKWRHWNGRVARGRGRGRVNTCIPSCAAGNIKKGPARLKMFKRHSESGRLMYGCMTGYTKIDGRRSRIEWPPGCAH